MKTTFYNLENINLNSEIEFETFLKRNNRLDITNAQDLKDFLFYVLEEYLDKKDEIEETNSRCENYLEEKDTSLDKLRKENTDLRKQINKLEFRGTDY